MTTNDDLGAVAAEPAAERSAPYPTEIGRRAASASLLLLQNSYITTFCVRTLGDHQSVLCPARQDRCLARTLASTGNDVRSSGPA